MNIDERLEALTMSLELMLRETEAHSKQIEAHSKQLVQDAENIRALARIAELHERRLTELEGGDQQQ